MKTLYLKSLLSLTALVTLVSACKNSDNETTANANQDFKLEVIGPQKNGDKLVFTNEFFLNSADFGCSGGNVLPELKWTGAPKDTKAFAITLFDKSAPTESGFWHWLAFNIPAETTSIAKNASATKNLPVGTIESNTDLGVPGYAGPCPPAGAAPHRYEFKIFALKEKLNLPANISAAIVSFNINQKKLAEAVVAVEASR